MQLLSINVGLPRELSWLGQTVQTAIIKTPVEGPVNLHTLNLEGDAQTDLRVHGGVTKAVYGYGHEHYAFWEAELDRDTLPFGIFGENLTIEGLHEHEIQIGDQFQAGSAIIMATEPRKPCNKLAMRFQQADMISRFLYSLRSGIYFSVVQEGVLRAGDEITQVHKEDHGITVSDIIRLDVIDRYDEEGLQKAAGIPALPDKWRIRFHNRLLENRKPAIKKPLDNS